MCVCHLSVINLEYRHQFSCNFISLSRFLLHFKNDSKNLTRETAQLFIPWMRFLRVNLVSKSFLVLLKYTFRTISSISVSLMVSSFNILRYLLFSFPPSILCSVGWDCRIHRLYPCKGVKPPSTSILI